MAWVDSVTPENGLADLVNQACRDRFGEAVEYTPQSTGVPESITTPFQALPVDKVLEQMQVEHSATGPVLDLRLADLSVSPARGDSCEVRGVTYEVTEVEDDSSGWARLWLLQVS